ncbi:MAG: zincin-like metallopeptidase domain-containing protein [Bryobacteraceae bacterium]
MLAPIERGQDRSYWPIIARAFRKPSFYSPQTDHVQMPPFANFQSPFGYYSTLAHELTYWTTAESRLNRNLQTRFGDASLPPFRRSQFRR